MSLIEETVKAERKKQIKKPHVSSTMTDCAVTAARPLTGANSLYDPFVHHDHMLLKLDSGARDTESSLMPPPPPPPSPQPPAVAETGEHFYVITINDTIQTIRVMQLNVVRWYEEQFVYQRQVRGNTNKLFVFGSQRRLDGASGYECSEKNKNDYADTPTATTLTKNDDARQ